MNTEFWYFISGLLLGLMPLLLLVAVKKLNLLGIRPDRKIVYRINDSQKLTLHAFKAGIWRPRWGLACP